VKDLNLEIRHTRNDKYGDPIQWDVGIPSYEEDLMVVSDFKGEINVAVMGWDNDAFFSFLRDNNKNILKDVKDNLMKNKKSLRRIIVGVLNG